MSGHGRSYPCAPVSGCRICADEGLCAAPFRPLAAATSTVQCRITGRFESSLPDSCSVSCSISRRLCYCRSMFKENSCRLHSCPSNLIGFHGGCGHTTPCISALKLLKATKLLCLILYVGGLAFGAGCNVLRPCRSSLEYDQKARAASHPVYGNLGCNDCRFEIREDVQR